MTPRRAKPEAPPTLGETALQAFRELDKSAPGCPLIHLGQTPFWDEPAKACIAARTERPILAGIHDLDYFSRQRLLLPGPLWQIVRRNDGTTRDFWIAAGELSALFGAEAYPTRQDLMEAGVRFDRITKAPGRQSTTFDHDTEAWGWRGLVRNQDEPDVICDVPAGEAVAALEKLLRWGTRESAHLLSYAKDRRALSAFTKETLESLREFVREHESGSLSELYLFLLKRAYNSLIGPISDRVEFTTTRQLLIFNRQTAKQPRFRFVNHFLHKRHGPAALEAYRRVIEHTGVTDPASAGQGALPFDVYVPGRGRGTLHVTDDALRVASPKPVRIPLDAPVRDVSALAAALEDSMGPDTVLVGKALVLPAMVCGEYVMLFTERGSAYIPRTQRLLSEMRDAGIQVRVHPILRIKLRTWSALSSIRRTFLLPSHLAQGFGGRRITSGQFARRWKQVVKEQKALIANIRNIGRACDLVRYLSQDQHKVWFDRLDECNRAQRDLLEVQRKADELRQQAMEVRLQEDETAEEIRMLERRRGEINRSSLRPLKRRLAEAHDAHHDRRRRLREEYLAAEREGKALLLALESKLKERRRLREKRRQLAERLRRIERGRQATAARKILRAVEQAGEKARLHLARNAILVSKGLPHANNRPAAWWFPALDPSGKWYKRVARTARFRTERLDKENA